MTVARMSFVKDGVVPTHQHHNEQFSLILSGSVRFTIGGEDLHLAAGQGVQIPGNVPHSLVALEDTVAIEVFSPIREDWIKGTANYFQDKTPAAAEVK
jgi:unsaturated pyranuronate lyase